MQLPQNIRTYNVCVCSVLARSNAKSDVEQARSLGYASFVFSAVGIIVTLCIAIIVVVLVYNDHVQFSYCNQYGCIRRW